MITLNCAPLVALVLPAGFNELGVVVTILLSIAGPALHWYAPRHRTSVAQRVRDRVMTESEARRQMAFVRLGAPAMTIMGLSLLGLGLCDLMLQS